MNFVVESLGKRVFPSIIVLFWVAIVRVIKLNVLASCIISIQILL